jgi:hypothetical protein
VAPRLDRLTAAHPGCFEVVSVAPLGSQLVVSRATIAALPTRSLSSVTTVRPLLTGRARDLQPAGEERMHCIRMADGTA